MWDEELIKEAKKIINNIYTNDRLPDKNKILRFTELEPENIKVIILGQDPYPKPGVANGRAFAVNKNQKVPMSLKNIFKEIKEVQGYIKTDETLESWMKQGVLLLNTSLTVKKYSPNSDKNYWNNFMKKLILWLDNNFTFTWVLWGNSAQKYSALIKNKKILDFHPSPLSYRHRNKNTFKKLKNIEW